MHVRVNAHTHTHAEALNVNSCLTKIDISGDVKLRVAVASLWRASLVMELCADCWRDGVITESAINISFVRMLAQNYTPTSLKLWCAVIWERRKH